MKIVADAVSTQPAIEVPFKSFRFAGGEMQVRLEPIMTSFELISFTITANLNSSDALMELLLATDAVRRGFGQGWRGFGNLPVHLVCPYLPYARQDRVCYPGEALALKVLCNLLNAQRYASVTVWDVHSEVSLGLLDFVTNKPASDFVQPLIFNRANNIVLVAPDMGARKRTAACSPGSWCKVVQADKKRDPNDGSIVGTTVQSDHIGGADFLMVDDICDGGRTFIELAKVLRPLTTGKVNLYVTHGIFSKGFEVFQDDDGAPLVDHIYVANSFVPAAELPARVTIL